MTDKPSQLSGILPYQLVAVAAAWMLFESFGYFEGMILVWAIGFSHYLLGLIYSRRQLVSLVTTPGILLPMTVLAVAGGVLYFQQFPLLLYFGLHHAINEAYIGNRFRDTNDRRLLSGISFLLHMTGFVLLAYSQRLQQAPESLTVLLVIFCGLAAVFFWLLLRDGGSPRSGGRVPMMASELMLMVLIPLDYGYYDIHLYHIVLYHFVFWAFYPAGGMLVRESYRSLLIYVFLTVVALWLFVSIKPDSMLDAYGLGQDSLSYYDWFFLLSYFHITLSFAISRTNPDWVVRYFTVHPVTDGH